MLSSPDSSYAQAAFSSPPGCLRRFLIPFLSILITSLLLVWGFNEIEIVQAGSPAPSVPDLPLSTAGISPIFTPEVQAWEEEILLWSESYQLDPNLVATVMQIESCGYVRAESGAGAKGLFQVMPYHFQDGENPFQPDTNARRGLQYLRQAREAGGSSRLALAGYNGGISGAARPEAEWSAETTRYVYWGLRIYKDAQAGADDSDRLQEWLSAGGERLCRLAREAEE